ncbi:MAG: ABC transporter ATP-binding protein, partial [Patescibacteria group bacterium]
AYWYSLFKLPYDIKRAAADTLTTAQLADGITNNVNVKLFTNYEGEEKRFSGVTQAQFFLRKKSWDIGTWGDIVQGALMVAVEFAVIYLSVKGWQKGLLGVGDIALLQTYLFRMFDKLWSVGRNIRVVYEALADANEMTEILLSPHEVQDAPDARTLAVKKGEVSFNNVSFTYPNGISVFKDFNLRIAPGERVAFVGPSGGGKSTIVKLLLRFFDARGGEITIDGQNIAKVTQDSLREALAFVPQDPILFHRSLMENIRYAKPSAGDEEIIAAAKLAHAHEFISSFPGGYDTLVGERGVKLSGGERQRVAIARAILKDAPILVLDEATSSLDSESELHIQDALRKLMKGRTTLVVAHRLSTIMQMDRIIVVERGSIVEEGKHKELVKAKKGLYQKLWEIQAGGFARPAPRS